MSGRADPIHDVLSRYARAVFDKDIDAFVSLYDDDVRVYDMWGAWSVRGVGAWRAMVADWFGSLGNDRVVVHAEDVGGSVAGDLAFGHAILTYAAQDGDGTPLRSLCNRITMGLRRAGDDWKIVHEHTSAPIDHATTKAILRR